MLSETLQQDTKPDIITPLIDPCFAEVHIDVKTVADLLAVLKTTKARSLSMLRTTAALLTTFLDRSPDSLLIDEVYDAKPDFRAFLKSRKYLKSSINSYVNFVRILLREAGKFGWDPKMSISASWYPVIDKGKSAGCADVVIAMARLRRKPQDVTVEDAESWRQGKVEKGFASSPTRERHTAFWHLLKDLNCTSEKPLCLVREQRGVPLQYLPMPLQKEVEEILRWKQAAFAVGRPKEQQIRPISADVLKTFICFLYGFAKNVLMVVDLDSISKLVHKPIVEGFVEWSINERRVTGKSLCTRLGSLSAAVRNHPHHSSLDLGWLAQLIESIPIESSATVTKRKSKKYVEYSVLETLPGRMRTDRHKLSSDTDKDRLAKMVEEELVIKWLLVLPWRQRNLRECRVGGRSPNLFFAKIPAFSQFDKPLWVRKAEERDPESKFWQFRFSPEETKTHKEVQALLPRQLVAHLEEYLSEYRPSLIKDREPDTLLIGSTGRPFDRSTMSYDVGRITMKYTGTRVNPHSFRDIVAYAWLKDHPQDYLTLSKLLWHSNINTTLQIYGSRFNESSGVLGMESWLDEREAKSA